MIRSVDFWARRQAEGFRFSAVHAVISNTDYEQAPAALCNPGDVLRLAYYDLPSSIPGTKFSEETLFSAEHARALHAFVKRIHDDLAPRDVVVHCEAGVSRSAAVALFVHAMTQCSFPKMSKASHANKRVVRMMQEATGIVIAIPVAVPMKSGIFIF